MVPVAMTPVAEPYLGEEELRDVIEAVKSGWFLSKRYFIEAFEQKFADYCDRKCGVATSNGSVALHLALKALGIGKDDEVIPEPSTTVVSRDSGITFNIFKNTIASVDKIMKRESDKGDYDENHRN